MPLLLNIEAIPGESLITGYEKCLVLTSINHSIDLQTSGDPSTGGRTTGRSNHGTIECSHEFDIASPKLALYASNATVIPTLTITAIRQDGEDLIVMTEITLTKVFVSSFSYGGGSDGEMSDSFSLDYEEIAWKHVSQTQDSGEADQIETQWNPATNTTGA
jgi:type VI secretion system Hcp family effector